VRRRPNVAVRFKLLIKRRVGLTLGLGRSLMHGVAPQMCGSSNQPIVRPRSRGSLPSYLCRLDWRPGTKCCFTCERARGALAYLRGRVPGRGLQFAALRFGARVHAHAPSGHSPSRQVRPATLVRHVVAGTVRGYEVFDEETLFALLATAQRVLAKSAHISRQPPASRRPPAFRDTRALLMASQDIALWVPAGSNRCRQLPVGHSNCRMSSPSRHSTFVGW